MSSPYPSVADGALSSPAFTVPAGGGVLGWYQWVDIERHNIDGFTWDGMVLEAKPTSDSTWTYLEDANYNHEQWSGSCSADFPFGATLSPRTKMFAGDGTGSAVQGDDHDREWLADLSQFAGDEIQVRWRFGTDANTVDQGIWIDTITLYDNYTADSWSAAPAGSVTASDAGCDAQVDLTVSAVAGASGYNWYRSEVSCAEAFVSASPVGTTAGTTFSDATVDPDVEYYYAVQAIEIVTECISERFCAAAGCCSTAPDDPTIIAAEKTATDVLFALDYDEVFADVYRDAGSNPVLWGAPHQSQISDESDSEADFQYTDVGAVSAGTIQFYLFTGSRCGQTLPPS
jgi:hypothetical protein